MKILRAIAPLFALLLVAGCSQKPQLEAPDGFAELEPGDAYLYRATNASGVVIAVRAEDNDPHGNLEFWTAALDNRLKKSGYGATSEAPEKITTDTGLVGRRLKYSIDRSGRRHEYWVTVFVTDSRVVVIEAAGDEAYFNADAEKQIDVAMKSVKLG